MSTIELMYINYLYNELGKDEAEKILAIPPGTIVLRNSLHCDLFDHPHVRLWHKFLLNYFSPFKPHALIMPCTSIKPYRLSPTHKIVITKLNKYQLTEYVAVYILSEPMVLVPQELDIYYPFANYEYPPRELNDSRKSLLIQLLSKILPKLRIHKYIVAILPRHHKYILINALNLIKEKPNILIIDYGRLPFKAVAEGVELINSLIKQSQHN